MKKFTAIAAFVLTMALVLCSFLMPAATTATGSSSNWTASSGSTIESESSEIWVVDTVTVTYSAAGWVQHKEQMTDLIGKNGLDGKGYINVIFGDGSVAQSRDAGYAHFQLVGKADPTIEIPYRTVCDKAIDWAFRGDGTDSGSSAYVNGRIANTQENDARAYGSHAAIAAEGYRVVFTRDADNYVMVRGIGNGVFGSALEYTGNIKSSKKLTEIPGDNGETAADGVYYRLYSAAARTITTTIAYPMPDDFDANTSRWVVGGGAAIANQSVEYLKVDYVDVSLSNASPCGFVQHKALLTDFFGENGKDGKGFVNVKAFDGDADLTEAKSYYFLQFVGKSDTSAVISEVPSDKAISWYNYSQAGHDYAGWYKNRNASGTTFKQYGTTSKFAADGQQFVFAKDADGHVMPRGTSVGITNDFQSYATTSALKSDYTLSQIVGDGGKTGADGVYLRIGSNVTSVKLELQLTIAYPYEMSSASTPTGTPTATPTATPEGVNLVPEDLLANKTNAQEWFGGTMPGTFTEEDGEYIYKATTDLNGMYTTHALPDGSFTVKMNIKPSEYVNGQNAQAYSGMGILLGRSAGGNAVPWTNIRFDADYATKKMQFYVWEKTSDNRDIVAKKYGTDWYEGTFPEDMWFEVIMEFTSTGTKIYLDGYEVPQMTDGYTPPADSLGHFPTADEIKFIGLFPSGAEYSIKNFEVYKGVNLQLGALAPVTPPGQTPNKPTGDNSMALIAMAMVLCAGAFVVMAKKRSYMK